MENSSLKTNAYNYIKQKLRDCEYAPDTFISEKLLIDELGMSRTPIREAIMRLEQEGLLEILPKRGIVVKRITVKDIVNLYEFRKMVECYAIRSQGIYYDKQILKTFKNRFMESEGVDHDLDDEFHKYIQDILDNQYVHSSMQSVFDQNRRARILAYSGTRSTKDTLVEHVLIIDSLINHEIPEAEAAMIVHLDMAKKATLALISEDEKFTDEST